MGIIYDGQVRMANMAIVAGFSVNGVARLHTEILKNQELHDFYEMFPEKFNNKTNGITQRRFLLHANPLLAGWITDHIGDDWITDLSHLSELKVYADDVKAQREFMQIKYRNKVRLAEYIQEHNGITVDPRSIFDVQIKRLHEYKRQLLNILHIMYIYNQLKANPNMDYPKHTFIFGAKAAAGYKNAKLTIKLINNVADVINSDPDIQQCCGCHQQRPGYSGQDQGRIHRGLPRIQRGNHCCGSRYLRADFDSVQGSIRHRLYEADAERRAHDRHDGRRER